jgi:hypothetical protein
VREGETLRGRERDLEREREREKKTEIGESEFRYWA